MARYSGPEDVDEKLFQDSMGEEYHEKAQAYLDIILRDATINPTELTKKYDVLKEVSIMKAKEFFLDSIASQNPAIVDQLERIRRDRISMETRFLKGVLDRIQRDVGNDDSTNAIYVQTGRIYRA